MIQASELRIGNIVKKLGLYRKVNKYDIFYETYKDFEPIPLSPEILEKAGFVKDSKVDIYRIGNFAVGQPDEIDVWQPLYSSRIIGNELSFAHQLQNLYFFLTGEELIINL